MNKSDKSAESRRRLSKRGIAKRLAKRLAGLTGGASKDRTGGPYFVSVIGAKGVEIEHGKPLLGGMIASGLQINHFCGGNGSCGTCKIEVVEGLNNFKRPTTAEVVAGAASEPNKRLACQARIVGPVTIRVRMQ